MKKIKILMMAILTILSVSVFAQKAGKKDNVKHLAIYTCSMHDSIASTKPGNCPVCGMKLHLSKKEEMKSDVVKNYSCPVHLTETRDKPGKCSKCGKNMTHSSKENMKMDVVNNYTCPMHGGVKANKLGKCPYCGMKLTK